MIQQAQQLSYRRFLAYAALAVGVALVPVLIWQLGWILILGFAAILIAILLHVVSEPLQRWTPLPVWARPPHRRPDRAGSRRLGRLDLRHATLRGILRGHDPGAGRPRRAAGPVAQEPDGRVSPVATERRERPGRGRFRQSRHDIHHGPRGGDRHRHERGLSGGRAGGLPHGARASLRPRAGGMGGRHHRRGRPGAPILVAGTIHRDGADRR